MKFKQTEQFEREVQWMTDFAASHVLSSHPKEVKDSLVVTPGEWSLLPANRRKRKRKILTVSSLHR